MAESAALATAAFAATNVDDLVVLSVLFARRDAQFTDRQIVLGQVAGFAVLVAVSLAASAGLGALPDLTLGALGLVPIVLGLQGLWRLRASDGATDEERGPPPMLTMRGVAAITVANGADNVAIYAPLFATTFGGDTVVVVVTFFVLVFVWCALGRLAGTRPVVVRAVGWAGDHAIPVVLLILGGVIVVHAAA